MRKPWQQPSASISTPPTQRSASYVRDRLKTILNDIFKRENFHVECRPASDPECKTARKTEALTAYVPAGNPNALVFCGSFFDRSEDDRASTIIHEFGHAQLGLTAKQSIIDRAYQWDKYYQYLTTAEALTNADSYPMFVREVATGSDPAKGIISDSETDCPKDWDSLIFDAITKARQWNHWAAKLRGGAPDEFAKGFKKLDGELSSNVGFKCKPHGGGRCDKDTDFFWYALGDLRICPRWRQISTPDERAIFDAGGVVWIQSGRGWRRQAGQDGQTSANASHPRPPFDRRCSQREVIDGSWTPPHNAYLLTCFGTSDWSFACVHSESACLSPW